MTIYANPGRSNQQTLDIDPMLARRLQRRANIGSMSRVCWVPLLLSLREALQVTSYTNMRCNVLARYVKPVLFQGWFNVVDAGSTKWFRVRREEGPA